MAGTSFHADQAGLPQAMQYGKINRVQGNGKITPLSGSLITRFARDGSAAYKSGTVADIAQLLNDQANIPREALVVSNMIPNGAEVDESGISTVYQIKYGVNSYKHMHARFVNEIINPAPISSNNVGRGAVTAYTHLAHFTHNGRKQIARFNAQVVKKMSEAHKALQQSRESTIMSRTPITTVEAEKVKEQAIKIMTALHNGVATDCWAASRSLALGIQRQLLEDLFSDSIPLAVIEALHRCQGSIREARERHGPHSSARISPWSRNKSLMRALCAEIVKNTVVNTNALAKNPNAFLTNLFRYGHDNISNFTPDRGTGNNDNSTMIVDETTGTAYKIAGIMFVSSNVLGELRGTTLVQSGKRRGIVNVGFQNQDGDFEDHAGAVVVRVDGQHIDLVGDPVENIGINSPMSKLLRMDAKEDQSAAFNSLVNLGEQVITDSNDYTSAVIQKLPVNHATHFILTSGATEAVLVESIDDSHTSPISGQHNLNKNRALVFATVGDRRASDHDLLRYNDIGTPGADNINQPMCGDFKRKYDIKPVTAQLGEFGSAKHIFGKEELKAAFLDPYLFAGSQLAAKMTDNARVLLNSNTAAAECIKNTVFRAATPAARIATLLAFMNNPESIGMVQMAAFTPYFDIYCLDLDEQNGLHLRFQESPRERYSHVPPYEIDIRHHLEVAQMIRIPQLLQEEAMALYTAYRENKSIIRKVVVPPTDNGDNISPPTQQEKVFSREEQYKRLCDIVLEIQRMIDHSMSSIYNSDTVKPDHTVLDPWIHHNRITKEGTKLDEGEHAQWIEKMCEGNDVTYVTQRVNWELVQRMDLHPLQRLFALISLNRVISPAAMRDSIDIGLPVGWAVDFYRIHETEETRFVYTKPDARTAVIVPQYPSVSTTANGGIDIETECIIQTVNNMVSNSGIVTETVVGKLNACDDSATTTGCPLIALDSIASTGQSLQMAIDDLFKNNHISHKHGFNDIGKLQSYSGYRKKQRRQHGCRNAYTPIIRPAKRYSDQVTAFLGNGRHEAIPDLNTSGSVSPSDAFVEFITSDLTTQNPYANSWCSYYMMVHLKSRTTFADTKDRHSGITLETFNCAPQTCGSRAGKVFQEAYDFNRLDMIPLTKIQENAIARTLQMNWGSSEPEVQLTDVNNGVEDEMRQKDMLMRLGYAVPLTMYTSDDLARKYMSSKEGVIVHEGEVFIKSPFSKYSTYDTDMNY